MHAPRKILIEDWGCIEYATALKRQEALFSALTQHKITYPDTPTHQDYLIFCTHPPVYTLGRGGDERNLLWDAAQCAEKGVAFIKTSRGGDITFHGPGQIVMYPIIDLEAYKPDISWYIRQLEESVIRTLADYGVESGRIKGWVGVWLWADNPHQASKICAIGVRCGRWITMHGIALNIYTEVDFFSGIIPCGIASGKVSTLKDILGDKTPSMSDIKKKLTHHFTHLLQECR